MSTESTANVLRQFNNFNHGAGHVQCVASVCQGPDLFRVLTMHLTVPFNRANDKNHRPYGLRYIICDVQHNCSLVYYAQPSRSHSSIMTELSAVRYSSVPALFPETFH